MSWGSSIALHASKGAESPGCNQEKLSKAFANCTFFLACFSQIDNPTEFVGSKHVTFKFGFAHQKNYSCFEPYRCKH